MLNATVIRARRLSVLIVGASGLHVLGVVSAFERERLPTVRAEDIPTACELIVHEMPLAVVVLVPTRDHAERDDLIDRALAVGALVVALDPHLDDATFQQVLEDAVHAVLERKRARQAAEQRARAHAPSVAPPDEDEIDGGWSE